MSSLKECDVRIERTHINDREMGSCLMGVEG